jgi:hypothetical protein
MVLGQLNYELEGRQLTVGAGDHLDLGGDRGLTVEEYSFDSHFRRDLADFADSVHGRVVADDKFVWLQYWLFYYYNDKAWVIGGHECDWEVVQFGFDRETGQRALATFSQHNHPEGRAWDDVNVKSGPDGYGAIVYVALQSHANYFEPGDRKIAASPLPFDLSRLGIDWLEEVVPGNLPLVRPHVVSIDDPPSWAKWPGRWGEDHAAVRFGPLRDAGNSPDAPCLKRAWNDPYAFHHGQSLPTKRGDGRRGRRVSALPRPTVASATRVDRSLAVAIDQPSLTARRRGSRTLEPNRVSVVVRRRGALEPAFLKTAEPGTAATSVELPPKFRDDDLEVQVALADPLGRVSLSDPVLVT